MSEDGKKIKNVIDTIFNKRSRLSTGFNEYSIESVWRQTFGDVISSYTTRVTYKNEILTVYINSAPLKEELVMHKTSVLDKLNANLKYKKVKEIYVR